MNVTERCARLTEMLTTAGRKWEGRVIGSECSQGCHWKIFSDRFSEYYYQNSLFGKQTSNQKATAAGENFSFVYTNKKYPTFFFVNYYLPADIRARR